jgi:NitT/TauT family transport system substrate-binding protein
MPSLHKLLISGAAISLLAACGGTAAKTTDVAASSSAVPSSAPAAPVKLTVGIIPISNMVPLVTAQKRGFFEEEGLTVETTAATGGVPLATALAAGKGVDIIYSNYLTAMQARVNGFPLTIIADQNRAGNQAPDSQQLIVKADGPIKSLADLRGKRIGVNALNNINALSVQVALEKGGLAPKDVTFVAVPFPSMGDAIAKGSIAAAAQVEPFATRLNGSGATRAISYPFLEMQPGLDIAGWISTEDFVTKNAKVVEGFVRALDKANSYLRDNADERIALIAEYTKSEPDAVKKLVIDQWPGVKVDADSLQMQLDLAKKFGLFKGDLRAADMVSATAK